MGFLRLKIIASVTVSVASTVILVGSVDLSVIFGGEGGVKPTATVKKALVTTIAVSIGD